jgi:hypothetical protein
MPAFIYDDLLPTLTLSSSNVAGSLHLNNTKSDVKGLVYRSSSATTEIRASQTTDFTVGAVVLGFTNLTPTATVRVRIQSTPSGGATLYDSGTRVVGVIGASGHYPVYFPNPVTGQRILINIVNNGEAYFQMGRWLAGKLWRSELPPDLGMQKGIEDLSKTFRTESGDLHVSRAPKIPKLSFRIGYLSAEEMAITQNISEKSGVTETIFVSPFVASTDLAKQKRYELLGKFEKPELSVDSFWDGGDQAFSFVSL